MKRGVELLAPALLVVGAAWPGAPPAALATAVLAALLAALGTAGWRLAARLLPGSGLATGLTAATVFATVLATLPATLFGHFGLLYPAPFLLWAAALHSATLWLSPAAVARPSPPSSPGSPRDDLRPPAARAFERALAISALMVLSCATYAQVRGARYSPPGTFGFDDLSYHLATVATWAEQGDLAMPKFAVGDDATAYYPIASELVSWVLLAPFETNDVAARWSQLPFALALLAAVAALGARLGLRKRSVLPALALVWSLERVFPRLALAASNDASTAFLLLASADGALELARRRSVGAALYAGTAFGLLLGTKYATLLFAPLPLALYALARIVSRGSLPARGRGLLPELAGAGAAALAGGYTFLRNAVTTGNPVFPAPVRVAGLELFAGWEHASLAWRRALPESAIELPGFLFRADLWGPVAPWLLVPAALLAPAVALLPTRPSRQAGPRETDTDPHRRWVEAALLAYPVLSFLIFLHLIYDHRDIRYFLGGIALAALGWAYLADRLERSGRKAAAALAAAVRAATYAGVILTLALRPAPPGARPALWLVAGAGLGLLASARWASVERGFRRLAAHPRRLAAAAALLALPVAAHVAARYPERKLEHRLMPRYLEEHLAGEASTTVAYVGLNAPYLYYGSRLQNRVVIVPSTGDLEGRLYRWRGSTAQPFRYQGRYRRWLGNLESLGVSYVVVVKAGSSGPERGWMLRHPDRFEQVAEQGIEEIWRFEPRAGPPP
jgi:hypothetical protein